MVDLIVAPMYHVVALKKIALNSLTLDEFNPVFLYFCLLLTSAASYSLQLSFKCT